MFDLLPEDIACKSLFSAQTGMICRMVRDMDETAERVQREIDHKFTELLRPIAQPYASCRGAGAMRFLAGRLRSECAAGQETRE